MQEIIKAKVKVEQKLKSRIKTEADKKDIKFTTDISYSIDHDEYTKDVWESILLGCDFFYKHYTNKHRALIDTVIDNKVYLTILDTKKNKFAVYEISENKVINSKYDTDMCQEYIKDKGVYEQQIHYYIV